MTSSVCLRYPQLMEVTGKNQDECMVALHDCNEDVGRAINFLLESTSDMVNNPDVVTATLSAALGSPSAAGQAGLLGLVLEIQLVYLFACIRPVFRPPGKPWGRRSPW